MSEASPSLVSRIAQRRGFRQFVKFGIVGLSGTFVNLVIFTALQKLDPAHTLPLHFYVMSSVAFLCGGVSNYFLNRMWTFRSTGHAGREGVQFLSVSVLALLVNLGVSWLVSPYLGYGHKTWFVALVASIFVNFFLNKYWTFRQRA
jgi:putative flippase GtrA